MGAMISLARAGVEFLGSRYSARPFREDIAAELCIEPEVALDFAGVRVGTSFLDELVGGLIMSHGSTVVDRLVFVNCDDNTRGLLEFVVSARLAEQSEISHSDSCAVA